jgi:hypothetical protein
MQYFNRYVHEFFLKYIFENFQSKIVEISVDSANEIEFLSKLNFSNVKKLVVSSNLNLNAFNSIEELDIRSINSSPQLNYKVFLESAIFQN